MQIQDLYDFTTSKIAKRVGERYDLQTRKVKKEM